MRKLLVAMQVMLFELSGFGRVKVSQSVMFMRILVMLCLLLMACQQQTTARHELAFFDLKGWVRQEVLRWRSGAGPLVRSVRLNGQTVFDTIKREAADIYLQPLAESDINKPVWLGRYKADTITSPRGQIYTYTALTPDLKTQKLVIAVDSLHEVVYIEAHNKLTQKVSTHLDTIVFNRQQSLKLASHQHTWDGKNYDLEVVFHW